MSEDETDSKGPHRDARMPIIELAQSVRFIQHIFMNAAGVLQACSTIPIYTNISPHACERPSTGAMLLFTTDRKRCTEMYQIQAHKIDLYTPGSLPAVEDPRVFKDPASFVSPCRDRDSRPPNGTFSMFSRREDGGLFRAHPMTGVDRARARLCVPPF